MKKLSTLLILLSTTGLLLAAPSMPITRGRLTTDLDAAGHSITNGPMATTNFVWDVVGIVTNNLPSGGGGLTTNDVQAIVADEGYIKPDQYEIVHVTEIQADAFAFGDTTIRLGEDYTDPGGEAVFYKEYLGGNRELAVKSDLTAIDIRTNLPPISATATVGDLVDALNAIANALRPNEEEEP